MFLESFEYGVVVGYDGSPASMRALRWGALTARSWAGPLTVCHVWSYKPVSQPGETVPAKIAYDAVVSLLTDGVARAAKMAGRRRVHKLLLTGAPQGRLAMLTGHALLTVVGSGNSWGPGVPPGRVSTYLAAHARGPVAAVPPAARQPCAHEPASVVVGTDGSPDCDPALGFAFADATALSAPVHVVCCHDPRHVAASRPLAGDGRAQEVASAALEPYRDRYPGVTVRTQITGEVPALALLEASACALLLVISSHLGQRRQGADPGAVARAVLAHACCPVVIVPARRRGPAAAALDWRYD